MREVVQGRLDEAEAHTELAEQHVRTIPPDRQDRLLVGVASLKLELAIRRGNFADVIEQMSFLSRPITAHSNDDVAHGRDLRAFALLILGIVEMWTLQLADAEAHLLAGAALGRSIGRPYLEATCLAHLGFPAALRSFVTGRQRCEEAISFAERHGWANDKVVAPALATLCGILTWTGEFGPAQRLLERDAIVSQRDSSPGTRLLVHLVTGMLYAGRGNLRAALEGFDAAEHSQSLMVGEHALSEQVSGWTIATQARLGMLEAARASLAGLPAGRAASGEVHNACAVIHLADGSPATALSTLGGVLNGQAQVLHDFTRVESHLLAARAHSELGDRRAATAAVEHALALAEPDRLILSFVMTGSRNQLEAHPRHESAHAALLVDILDVMRDVPVIVRDRPALPPVQELTETELRVLRFLPTNLSRQDIARELYLSVNTVSTHVRNIYATLDARDRSMAVDRARELRLLSRAASH
jgi:LuxR family maltose regulon positive regulatory protein